jgi:MinD-like ATPase involved in chromosome partitioning or flagellar assembly
MTLRLGEGDPRRTSVVAVAGAKGSPGCTFVAVGLARCLADRGVQTLLVDADGEEAGIAPALALPCTETPDLERAAALGWAPEVLRDAAVDAGTKLRALDLTSGGDSLPGTDGRDFVAATRQDQGLVVLDLGHAWGRFQRQLAAAADWVVWVLMADRQGVERADRRLSSLALTGGRGLVVNRSARWGLAGADRALVERHAIPLLARIPEHAAAARRVSERGAAAHRQRAFRPGFERIARTVHPDVEGTGSWP